MMHADTESLRGNLSAAALKHKQLTLFFILAIAIAGIFAFFKLGQREDPDFTFRVMVVRAAWPGATTSQVDQFVTDKIERLAKEYGRGHVYRLDGISVEFDDWHFNVRPSNTEPLLRLNLEGTTPEIMERRRDEVLGIIRS